MSGMPEISSLLYFLRKSSHLACLNKPGNLGVCFETEKCLKRHSVHLDRVGKRPTEMMKGWETD